MMKTVIYGGSFDPVHRAHEAIIKNLAERFDEVIVVPTFISPFKKGESVAPAELRLKMLNSIDLPKNATVSDIEIERGGTSYSIDTVRHFASKDRKIYFAIGSEGSRSACKWRSYDELKKLCEFYVIKRPGYDDGDTRYTQADFCGEDISSSEVKVAVAFGRLNGLVSEPVQKIIEENGLYTDYCRYVEAYKIFGMKSERIEHTYRATLEGIKLAKRYDVPVKDAVTALIVHDIGKYVSPEKLLSMGIPAPNCADLPEPCRHAEYGAAIAEHYFGLKPEIVEAVRTHTTCAVEMTPLAEITALADYIEPGRKFVGIEEIRSAAKKSLSLAVELMLKQTIEYLGGKGAYIAPVTVEAYKKYRQKNENNL